MSVNPAQPVPGAQPQPQPPHGPLTPPAEAILQLRHVSRVYGTGDRRVVAVDNVSLTVLPGEFIAVMGPSGSGKSTFLHLAGGLDTPTSGEVRVAGTVLSQLSVRDLARVRRRQIGYVFQNFNLLPGLTVLENVAFPLELDGVSWKQAAAAARKVCAACGIERLLDRRPDDISGGQAQRVAIARALVGDRRLVLADEPTGALDTENSHLVIELLRERADAGAAVVMVTHEPRFAAWADRTVYFCDGAVTGDASPGTPETLLRESRAQ